MFGSEALEVAIGLIFLFFILSLLVTSARELIEGWLQTRAIHLERGLRELLQDEKGTGVTSEIYKHPLVSALFRGSYNPTTQLTGTLFKAKNPWQRLKFRSNLPSYIPSRNFALALLDLSARGEVRTGTYDGQPISFEQIRAGITTNIKDERLQRAVLVALDQAKGDLEQARVNLEAWYDSAMDRVSGWYRKQTQWVLFGIGLVTAVSLNIDTIRVAQELQQNHALRSVIVAEAEATTQRAAAVQGFDAAKAAQLNAAIGCDEGQTDAALAKGKSCAQLRLEKLQYPMGWKNGNILEQVSLKTVVGWLLTALAVTLGAPFWFDMLNKIMVIRSTVKPHEKSPEESSEDRQRPRTEPRREASPLSDHGHSAPPTTPLVRRDVDDAGFQPHQWRARPDPEEGLI